MARIRSIKVDLFVDDSLAEVSVEAHLLLAGLPCIADSAGRLEDRPRRIQALLMPYRPSVDVEACLRELHALGAIRRYEAAGQRYVQVLNWERDQRPHVREPDSAIPPPPPDSTEHRPGPDISVQGGELAGNSPGTRPSRPAGIRDSGYGVLDLGSGILGMGVPAVASAPAAPAKPRKAPRAQEKPTDPRHAPLVKALVEGQGWHLGGGRGAKAIAGLLAAADEREETRGDAAVAEVLSRAARARQRLLEAPQAFPRVAHLWELAAHWAHFEGPPASPRHPPCAACGSDKEGNFFGEPEVYLGYGCRCAAAWMDAGQHFSHAAEWAAQRRKHAA